MLILGSTVVSQMCFVGTYTNFVSENLQAFVLGISECTKHIPVKYFTLIQLVSRQAELHGPRRGRLHLRWF